MRFSTLLFVGFFLVCFSGLNYYIGIRGWQAFQKWFPVGFTRIYVPVFILLAFSYLLGRIIERLIPGGFSDAITLFGSYWIGAAAYFLIITLCIDFARLFDHWFSFLPASVTDNPGYVGLAVIMLVIGLMIYGTWNARHPRVYHYDIAIDKPAGKLQQLHMVMASDMHLGNIVDEKRLARFIDQANALQPDIVVLPGDTIDEDVKPYLYRGMPAIFQRLHPKYGVFAIPGNHEYIGGEGELALRTLRDTGMTVLRDTYQEIDGSFYLVGRDDRTGARFTGHQRKPLVKILQGVDKTLPVILLDHQPVQLEEAAEQGVDLQLSGHTHHGQFFPNNLITQSVFEKDWGYLRRGAYQLIVSCGYGTWGPPIRIGNTPEMLDIIIRFKPSPHR